RQKAQDLWSELRAFPENRSFYSSYRAAEDEFLQGDGWRGLRVIEFHSLERKVVSGLILSNSCDISVENRRILTPTILFAPIIRLKAYQDLLMSKGQAQEKVSAITESIRKQRTTSIFYLPSEGGDAPERLAVLDDIHGHPLDDFVGSEKSRLFVLNQFAHYLLLFKISIHFSRMVENIER